MSARIEPPVTAEFADIIDSLADAAKADISVDRAEELGWLVEPGSALVVTDHESEFSFLITVQKVGE